MGRSQQDAKECEAGLRVGVHREVWQRWAGSPATPGGFELVLRAPVSPACFLQDDIPRGPRCERTRGQRPARPESEVPEQRYVNV